MAHLKMDALMFRPLTPLKTLQLDVSSVTYAYVAKHCRVRVSCVGACAKQSFQFCRVPLTRIVTIETHLPELDSKMFLLPPQTRSL